MSDPPSLELSVVIPVYGSEAVLPELVARLKTTLDAIERSRGSYEIIFVCDSSPDHSWGVIRELSARHSYIHGILLRVNAGQHSALMAGFSVARGKVIVTMDDDLQHSPSDIPTLLDELARGRDAVFARFKERKHPKWKTLGSRLNDLIACYLLNKPKGVYLSPFRALKASIREDVLRYRGPYVYVDGLILAATGNIGMVEVDHHERYAGHSDYGFWKSLSLWMKMATGFSVVPLRITSVVGFCFSGLGFIIAIVFVIQKLTLDRMPDGWSSLMVTILVVGGVQLLGIGMLGEYLGRVLLTLNLKPQYLIGETTNFPGPEAVPTRTTG